MHDLKTTTSVMLNVRCEMENVDFAFAIDF